MAKNLIAYFTWSGNSAHLAQLVQGAAGRDLAGCFDPNGGGAVVNASRSLLCAHQKLVSHPPAAALSRILPHDGISCL